MMLPFDIFKNSPDGVRWVEASRTLEDAKSRIQIAAMREPGEYLILNQAAQKKIVIKSDPTAGLRKVESSFLRANGHNSHSTVRSVESRRIQRLRSPGRQLSGIYEEFPPSIPELPMISYRVFATCKSTPNCGGMPGFGTVTADSLEALNEHLMRIEPLQTACPACKKMATYSFEDCRSNALGQ